MFRGPERCGNDCGRLGVKSNRQIGEGIFRRDFDYQEDYLALSTVTLCYRPYRLTPNYTIYARGEEVRPSAPFIRHLDLF